MTVDAFLSREAGSCSHPAVDPEIFFPKDAGDPNLMDALQLCRGCPIRDDCLRFALAVPQSGVWGGTTEQQRRALARAAGRKYQPREAPAELFMQPHGSEAACKRHTRKGEPLCGACEQGWLRRTDNTRQSRYRRVAS